MGRISDAIDAERARKSPEGQLTTKTHLLEDPTTGDYTIRPLDPETVQRVQDGALELSSSASVGVVMPDGETYVVGGDSVRELIARGGRIQGASEERYRRREEELEQAYGDQPGLALVQGVGRGVTLGATDALGSALGIGEDMRETAARSPVAATVGEVGGAIGGVVLSGGTNAPALGAARTAARYTPAAIASRTGARIAARGGESLLGRTAARTAGGAVEGALYGAGTGVSDLALSEEPIDAERAVSVLSSRALYGAAIGGGVGGGVSLLGDAASAGLRRAKRYADEIGASSKVAGEVGDLATLDRAGLRAARETEMAAIEAQRVADKAAIAGDIGKYRALADDVNPFLAAESPGVRKVLVDQQRAYRRVLGNEQGLKSNPGRALDALQREQQALRTAAGESQAVAAKIATEEAAIAKAIGLDLATAPPGATVPLAGKAARRYADWSGTKLSRGKALELAQDDALAFQRAIEAGEVQGARATAIKRMDEVIAANDALQQRISAVYAAPTSTRLEAIAAAGDALATRGGRNVLADTAADAVTRGTVGAMAGGPMGAVIGFAAPRAIGMIKDLVLGRLAKAGAEASKRIGGAIDTAISAGKVVGTVTRRTAPRAVMASISYDAAPAAARPAVTSARRATPGLSDYQAREAEILAATEPGLDGRPRVRRHARARIAETLAPMAVVAPLMSDRMESVAVRRLEFMASKLPRRPDAMGLAIGPSRWRPSDLELASFARYAAAVEDPASVLERVADTTVTPEDAEALREVYPELFAETRATILGQLGEIRESLPYARKLALSILLGAPVDPSMDPRIIRVLQGHYEAEPGTEGGTAPPMAQPQFGAVRSTEEPTSAQRRAG